MIYWGCYRILLVQLQIHNQKKINLEIEPIEAPDFQEYFISLENIIGKYEDLIIKKITDTGFGMLQDIIAELDEVDSIDASFCHIIFG